MDKAKRIIRAAITKENKKRYTFTLSPRVKEALAQWCKAEKAKESTVIEELLKDTIPVKFLKD